MPLLSTYITQVRRLLHDPNGQFWPDTELTDYINEARNKVAQDTKCLRTKVAGLTLTANVEAYTIASFVTVPANLGSCIDIMNIDLYWGSTRYQLSYMPWTQFSAYLRFWQNNYQRPYSYSRLGALQFYVGPNPDQNYVIDVTAAFTPTALVSDSTTDLLVPPFTDPVKYYAAHLAKFKEQALGESNLFAQQYKKTLLEAQRAFMTRVIPDIYGR